MYLCVTLLRLHSISSLLTCVYVYLNMFEVLQYLCFSMFEVS